MFCYDEYPTGSGINWPFQLQIVRQQMPANPETLVWILASLVALVGLILLRIGLRGRRIHDRPLCKSCAYELSGRGPESVRCPECGGDISTAAGVFVGAVRRRSGFVAAGSLALFVSMAVVGVWFSGALQKVNWNQYKPNWWLVDEARNAAHKSTTDVLDELNTRLAAKKLSEEHTRALIKEALRIQADATLSWKPEWGEIFEQARMLNLVTDGEWLCYAKQGVPRATLHAGKKPFLIGDNVEFEISCGSTRLANKSVLQIGYHITRPEIIGITIRPREWVNLAGGFCPGRTYTEYNLLEGEIALAREGKYIAISHISFDITEAYGAFDTTVEFDISANIQFKSKSVNKVSLIKDERRRPKIELVANPSNMRVSQGAIVLAYKHGMLDVGVFTYAYARSGDKLVPLGSIKMNKGTKRSNYLNAMFVLWPDFTPVLASLERADIVLYPNVENAKQAGEMEIWGEPIEFKGLSLRPGSQ